MSSTRITPPSNRGPACAREGCAASGDAPHAGATMSNPPANISPTLRAIIERVNRRDFFFVNVGANDGVSNDVVYPFIREYGWRGIVVEPLAPMSQELQRNYQGFNGIIFERAAIAAKPRPFYYIPAASGYE